ncbi:LecA/PA-IL family lectin [Chelativorans salis]|uniref:LecA/PA-IL family lectin n=1 Tax=Chelativorans salis TaxID=2978478 RepID=A0ABT2LLL2_9HYPH|nr:LecA/PA-IL family lectin [Chelativorans sp. EGI FJ00035]MCT7375470.1 LecA/PA-IL family lectin [Chelativorans sp. EGI FJ00035]
MWHGKLDASAEQGKATSVHLKEDDVITITVTGSAKNGPAAPEEGPDGDPQNKDPKAILPGTNVGAVLMRIGKNGELKEIGTGVSHHHFQEEGEITFLYNDVPGEYGNNSGTFDVTVERVTPAVVWKGTLEATNEPGVRTGHTVSRGDVISITVTGTANAGGPNNPDTGPDGALHWAKALLPSANVGACLMKIGNGDTCTVVGSGLSHYTVQEDGEIAFLYNDQPGQYGDNSGSYEITLTA